MTASRDARIARRQRLASVWLPGWMVDPWKKCSHTRRQNIYGDEITAAGYHRSRCLICGRLRLDLYPPAETQGGDR